MIAVGVHNIYSLKCFEDYFSWHFCFIRQGSAGGDTNCGADSESNGKYRGEGEKKLANGNEALGHVWLLVNDV